MTGVVVQLTEHESIINLKYDTFVGGPKLFYGRWNGHLHLLIHVEYFTNTNVHVPACAL